MNKKNVGALNKKEMEKKKTIIIIAVVVVVLIALIIFLANRSKEQMEEKQKANVSEIIEKAQTKVVYVESSDEKKCSKCKDIKKYLDDKNINYLVYDVEDHSNKEYIETLKKLEINPSDFGYPAVVYIKEGRLYSNVINLTGTSALENFIKTYELKDVK